MRPMVYTLDTPEEDIDLGFSFTASDEDYIIGPNNVTDITEPAKKRRKKKEFKANTSDSHYESDVISSLPSNYRETYLETDNLLKSSIAQIDTISANIEFDLNAIRKSNSRNKYTSISNLTGTQAALIGNKISAIREMNNTISKAHELEFKRLKDMKLTQTEGGDDKAIMELYSSMISNPNMFSVPAGQQGFNSFNATVVNTPLIQSSNPVQEDAFNTYMQNITPEQNMMLLESNPNVEEVVCYNPTDGTAYFDVIDVTTGQSIPNTPKKSSIFLDNTIIDQETMRARNNKLGQSWRLVYVGNGKYTPPSMIDSY